jgi:hypothetical protein
MPSFNPFAVTDHQLVDTTWITINSSRFAVTQPLRDSDLLDRPDRFHIQCESSALRLREELHLAQEEEGMDQDQDEGSVLSRIAKNQLEVKEALLFKSFYKWETKWILALWSKVVLQLNGTSLSQSGSTLPNRAFDDLQWHLDQAFLGTKGKCQILVDMEMIGYLRGLDWMAKLQLKDLEDGQSGHLTAWQAV